MGHKANAPSPLRLMVNALRAIFAFLNYIETIIHPTEKTYIDVPVQEPWFELWRETFLTVQFPSDHEYTRHFLGCLIVLSSSDANPLDSAHQLTAKIQMLQNSGQSKLPKWFAPADALNCYVMLHDGCNGDISKAQQAFESLQLTFGENRCFLLQINSTTASTVDTTNSTDPWLKYLKRHPKGEQGGAANELGGGGNSGGTSAPRTPQEPVATTTPPSGPFTETPISSGIASEEVVDHPLSPVQEHAIEAIVSKRITLVNQLQISSVFERC